MSLAAAFESIALGFSAAGLGPYHAARAVWPGEPVVDDGGSIVTPGTPVLRDCSVQVDAATDAMRADAGFVERDMRLLVIGLDTLDTAATIAVLTGPNAGRWSVQSCERDPAAVGWVVRGRRGA